MEQIKRIPNKFSYDVYSVLKAENNTSFIRGLSKMEWMVSLVLFLLSMNVLNLFNKIILAVFLITIVLYPPVLKQLFNKTAAIILTFTIFYSLLIPEDPFRTFYTVVLLFVGYVFGRQVIIYTQNAKKAFIFYLIVIALGCAFHGILSIIYNYLNVGPQDFSRRMYDIWTGPSGVYGATSQAVLFAMIGGTAFYVLFLLKRNVILKFIYVGCLIFLVLNGLMFASRSALAAPILALLVSFVYSFIVRRNFKLLITFVLFTLLIILFYNFNILNVKTLIETYPLMSKMDVAETSFLNDPRYSAYSFFLNNMSDYPFGGLNQINPMLYMHNLWLDVYAQVGVIPFVILLLITARHLISLFKVLTSDRVDFSVKVLLVGLNTSIFAPFFTEPMMEASLWFVILFFIISGLTDGYLSRLEETTSY